MGPGLRRDDGGVCGDNLGQGEATPSSTNVIVRLDVWTGEIIRPGDPVRRGPSVQASLHLEYRINRMRAMTPIK
jgi:hypothetical protein